MSKIPERCVQVFKGHEGPVYCSAFENTGSYLLTGGHDRNVNLYNVQSGTLISTFTGHGYPIHDLSISPNGNTFLTASGRTLHLWDTAGQRIIRRFTGHLERLNAVTFGAQDSIAASASYDRTIRLWDLRSGRFPLMVLDQARDSVTSIHLHRHMILAGSVDGHVRSYDIRKGSLTVDNIQHPVTSVRFTDDCQAYIAASLDSSIRLFDSSSGMALNTYTGHLNLNSAIRATLFADDAFISAGSEDGSLFIWDLLSGKAVKQLAGHQQSITSVTPHPKLSSALLTCSLDGTARLWA